MDLPSGARATTIGSKTDFLGGAPAGTTVRGQCTRVHRGRTTMVWQTRITGENGRFCAIVIQTQLVIPA